MTEDPCPLCTASPHSLPAEQEDEFGLTCPGSDATEEVKEAYLYLRSWNRSTQHIATTDWTAFGTQAKTAYHGRARSEITLEALTENCDEVTAVVAPVFKARELLETDGPDLEVPHLTTLGTVPPRSLIPDENAGDYVLYLGSETHE